jgi:hypothetical protein
MTRQWLKELWRYRELFYFLEFELTHLVRKFALNASCLSWVRIGPWAELVVGSSKSAMPQLPSRDVQMPHS